MTEPLDSPESEATGIGARPAHSEPDDAALGERPEQPEDDTIDARLARRLADLRAQRGWSLADLASRTGMSRSTLSRLERAEISPTAALLGRLAAAYERTASRLLSEVESQPRHLVRAAEQPVWRDQSAGFVRRSVSPPHASLRGEVIEALLRPGADISYDLPPVPGVEQHIWMLAGSLEFTADDETYVLLAGDCLRMRLWGRSRLRCLSPEPARYALFVLP
jgi:transcriptional regulator with XRE-family HTH domain